MNPSLIVVVVAENGNNPMTDSRASVLITDLDNTLFDWFEQWYRSFDALVGEIERISGLSRESLYPEIKEIFQKHGTSEYAFLLQEMPSLRKMHHGENLLEVYDDAVYAYRKARKQALQLYPTVGDTLQELKSVGVLLVAYTESLQFYSRSRVISLGLDGLLDYLYCPPDHSLPDGMTTADIRKLPNDRYELVSTQQKNTPEGEVKPNPMLLLDIIADIGASPSDCVYVGDSLSKDIRMAQEADVLDAFAAYGVAHTSESYDLLRTVTHWTPEQVEAERKLKEVHVNPTIRLDKFSDIKKNVEFIAHKS